MFPQFGDPTRYNFVTVFDDFPVPAPIAVTGHDAVLNAGSHVGIPHSPSRGN